MREKEVVEDVFKKISVKIPGRLISLGILFLIIGTITMVYSIFNGNQSRTWGIFLVNFLFFTGISQAGLVFSAVLRMTNANWGKPILRIAEATASFLPVSLMLFLIMCLGRKHIFLWITHPIPEKHAWLNFPFLFLRDGMGMLIIYSLSLLLLHLSLKPDLALIKDKGGERRKKLYSRLSMNWKGTEEEFKKLSRTISILCPIITILYAIVFTIIAWDLVMSLDPMWYSTLFGGYFCIGAFFSAIASITIISVLIRRFLHLQDYITASQFHDLGKLLFGFTLLWTYLFWAQYLTIWYGNIPEETEFVFKRINEPYRFLALTIITCNFILPFLILLMRKVKMIPWAIFSIATIILLGMWLERYILVIPSIYHKAGFSFGLTEVLITLGFFSAFCLTFLAFLRAFPIISLHEIQAPSTFSHKS